MYTLVINSAEPSYQYFITFVVTLNNYKKNVENNMNYLVKRVL